MRITRIGLFVNLGMAVGKGIGGYVFHSQGLHYKSLAGLRFHTDLTQLFLPMLCTVSQILSRTS